MFLTSSPYSHLSTYSSCPRYQMCLKNGPSVFTWFRNKMGITEFWGRLDFYSLTFFFNLLFLCLDLTQSTILQTCQIYKCDFGISDCVAKDFYSFLHLERDARKYIDKFFFSSTNITYRGRKCHLTSVFLPGKFHRWKSLVG